MKRVCKRDLSQPDLALSRYTRFLDDDLKWLYEAMKAPVCAPYAFIPEVLTPEGLELLETLEVPINGKCSSEALEMHPIAKGLIRMMGRMSLMNRYYSYDPDKVVASLRNESGENVSIPPHRDLLDGHAVVYNWGVEGDLFYIIDGKKYRIENNELVVLNGAADWLDVSKYTGKTWGKDSAHLGGVTVAHSVIGTGYTSRSRLLVYADGQETLVTQIPIDESDPRAANRHYDNPNLPDLRPELARYGESSPTVSN